MFPRKKPADVSAPRRRSAEHEALRPAASDLSNRYAFRRNRTLTGSSSAKIISSNELNAEFKSPRAHVHHLTSLRRRLLMYFSIVGLSAFAIYLVVSQLVATTSITVSGVTSVPDEATAGYAVSIDSYYQARPSERLRFLLDEPALLSHVQAEHPEVRRLRIEPGSAFGEASVVVQARTPIARWAMSDGDQFVDADGVVFSRNYFESPQLQIIDNSGIQADTSRLVASDRFLGFVGKVIARSKQSGLVVSKVTIPAFTTRQIAVTIQGRDTSYKLSVDRPAGEQVEDMSRIVRYMTAKNITPQYVDVRLSGKAFYK